MKKIIIIGFCLFSSIGLWSQVTVGLKNNQYCFFEYYSKVQIGVKIEQSLYSEVMKYQHCRLYGLYKKYYFNNVFCLELSPYFGTTYAHNFYEYGCFIDLMFQIGNHFWVNGIVNPQYESYYEKTLNYQIAGEWLPLNGVGLFVQYTTIPLYRTKEERICCGIHLQEKHLNVYPSVSFPMKWNSKQMRILVSLSYQLNGNDRE